MAKVGKRIMQLVMAGEEMGHVLCRMAGLYSKVHCLWFLRSLLRIVLSEYIEKREQVEGGKEFWDIEAFVGSCVGDAERRALRKAGKVGAESARALLTKIKAESRPAKVFGRTKTVMKH